MAKFYEINQEIIQLLLQSMQLREIYTSLTVAFIDSPELRSKLTEPLPGDSLNNYVQDIVVQLADHGKLASGELALVQLLNTIKSQLSIEKQRRIEELIQAIDDEFKPKKPLHFPADILVQHPPSIDREGFQSVLFRRFDEIHNGRSVTERSCSLPVDSVYTEWVRTENSSHILILILDFGAEVQQNLLQISNQLETSYWIRGENLINLDKSRTQERTDSENLSSSPPTHLFIDFSGVSPEAIFVDLNSDNGVDNRLYFNENLSNLCSWASSKGHRVVIGIPRFMLGFLKIEEFNQYNASTFVSAELYSHHSNYYWTDYCQQFLNKSLPLKEVLFPLIKANSSALPKVVAQFLSGLTDGRFLKISVDKSYRTIVLIDLARKLTEKGFYEVAYRLELYCRTLEQQHGLISLDADIHFVSQHQDINQKIVGFIRGVENTPAILKHGTLTGQWGVGKTTAFLQMEHFWSLPQLNTDRGNQNSWIPLFIELGKEQSGNLWDEIRSQLKKNAYWEEHGRGKRYPLACHALLSKIISVSNIRWLFNSPFYFLLDCIDLLSSDQKDKLAVELDALRDLYPESGFLLAFREGEGLEVHRLGNVRIRNLNEYQIQESFKHKNTPISLTNLLGINNQTIFSYLHNPYILNIVCQLAFEARNLENLNLQQLLETHININKITNRITPEKAGEVIDEWLPQKALQMRVKKSSLLKLEDSQEFDLITRARRLGILRGQTDKYLIQFSNKLLWDYFVAKRLFQLGLKRNIKDILRENISEIGDIYLWKDILKILAGFLSGNQNHSKIKGFIEFLDAECFKKNVEDVDKLNLVHECLQEIPDARKLRSLQPHFKQVEELIELNRKKSVKVNVEIVNSLGFLDPRINPDDPLQSMIDVPGTEFLKTFKIGQFPVTNMEFAKFVEDGGYSKEKYKEYWVGNSWQWLHDNNIKYPRYWHNEQFNQPNYPVVGVSLYEALAYCLWLREKYQRYVFYLPTMEQWDLVAHGPNSIFDELLQKLEQVYKEKPQRQSLLQKWFPTVIMLQKQLFGHDNLREIPNRSERQNEDEIDEKKISKDLIAKVKEQMRPYQIQLEDEPVRAVGVFSPNEIGCFDLFGNVWQWCNTRSPEDVINFQYGPYESAIVKGGYWGNPIWTVMGGWFDPFLRFHRLGFRICCTKS